MLKKKKIIEINNSLLNVIAPMGLKFTRNSFILGESVGKVYGVIKYPPEPEYGWLSKLMNIPGTIANINFQPIDSGDFVDTLSRNILKSRNEAETARDPKTQARAIKAALDGEKTMVQIDQHGETVGLMAITIAPLSREDERFSKIAKRVETACTVAKCKPRTLSFHQDRGLKTLSPYYSQDPIIGEIINRPVPLSSFIGGFPFSASGFNDGQGYYFGKDSNGGLIILDPWYRGGDRTNTNFVIMGVAGVGKSTKVKDIIVSEYARGTKIIIVDPEREYKETCLNLEGDWINAGGGSKGRINPLQIRPVPVDDENEDGVKLFEDDGNGMGDMALHIKTLEIFFNLYLPSLTDVHRAILKKSLIELYNKFNIFWDTDINKLKNTDFPIFSDLYALLIERAAEKEKTRKELEPNHFDDLALLLEDISNGSDSFLWNGHTSIDPKTRCVCLDTLDLQNTPDNIKSTQYFNILSWGWQQMSFDRDEKVLMICDEAYLMIDHRVPQSLVFLRNAEKRSRKYEAGIGVVSHSVVDFLHENIRMYGQALLDIPTYKVLMGTDGKNLQETKDLYNLTDAEEELLASKKRKEALLMIGSKRLHAIFDIPDYKMVYIGSGGGR